MNHKMTVSMLSQIRKISTQSTNFGKNHYDSLGLAKNATQADVKGAYYELSKVYHPDKNHGNNIQQREKHSQKFKEITEAYEVLGNVKTRRMYDKGFWGDSPHTTHSSHQEDPLHKFYKSREVRHRPPAPNGRTPIYDFDEWSRKHYGEAFRRGQEIKERHAFYAKLKEDEKENYKLEVMMWASFIFLSLLIINLILVPDYDTPSPRKNKEQEHQKATPNQKED